MSTSRKDAPNAFRQRESFAGISLDWGERAHRDRDWRSERRPISPLVRQLVYRRDGHRCQHCGATPNARDPHRRSGALHLDHIVPWSAGGTDRSDNLRTLCGPCNYARSNFVNKDDTPAMPIVRTCAPCLTRTYTPPVDDVLTVYCGTCSHESWALPGWAIL